MSVTEGLVSPLATSFTQRRPAAPLPDLAQQPVALIDSMRNPGARWGRALLDGVEQALVSEGATFGRVRRDPLSSEPAEAWSHDIAARYRAAVIAVGD